MNLHEDPNLDDSPVEELTSEQKEAMNADTCYTPRMYKSINKICKHVRKATNFKLIKTGKPLAPYRLDTETFASGVQYADHPTRELTQAELIAIANLLVVSGKFLIPFDTELTTLGSNGEYVINLTHNRGSISIDSFGEMDITPNSD